MFLRQEIKRQFYLDTLMFLSTSTPKNAATLVSFCLAWKGLQRTPRKSLLAP